MSTTSKFLALHPTCCFCGGSAAAEELDHQPAKIIFPDKHRPRGEEFPACSICNRQSSSGEALLAFVCRFAGSHRKDASKDFHRLKDIFSSIQRSFPGLLERMKGKRVWMRNNNGILVRTGAIDVNQPEINLELCRLAAKLALANYYSKNQKIAQEGCRINTLWTHSQNPDTSSSVSRILQMMPGQISLKMGKWTTSQTYYAKSFKENGVLFFIAIFHETVALLAQLHELNQVARTQDWQHVMTPKVGAGIQQLVL